jgi:thioesterase domain-containing protein
VTTTINRLTPIWQRVLQRPSIGVDDNFFDLGGDPASAVQVFAEIAEVCGQQLPPETIYAAPTIAALAALLEQPATPRCPALVMLKPGTEEPSVFIAHGLGGSVLEFFHLAKRIQTRHAIYGMQPKGLDGMDQPLASIEDMAEFYIDAIRKLQAHGPYILIGYSLGGLITLEMAHRLSESGEKVGLLALVDGYPHPRYLPFQQRLRLNMQLARLNASALRQLPPRRALSYLLHSSERAALRSERRSRSAHSFQSEARVTCAAAFEAVRQGAAQALARYSPRFYPGKIRFVKPKVATEFPDDPTAVWAHLAGDFALETVPGNHRDMLETHVDNLASVLSRYLKEAFCQNEIDPSAQREETNR